MCILYIGDVNSSLLLLHIHIFHIFIDVKLVVTISTKGENSMQDR